MNLGEFIIKIGTQADTKQLENAAKKLEEAEKKTRRLINYFKELGEATSDNEKKLIKKNFALQTQADKIKSVVQEQNAYNASMQKGIATAMKFIGAIKLGVIVLDRMGNSLLRSNQQYFTFQKQSGISISRLNRMAGIAQMAGTGLSPEQVAGDIQSLQHKIFRFERFGENAKTFGMLGINPRGMDSDKLILSLRKSLSRYSGRVKSEILTELGLSQEWLHVLDLSDEKFKEYVKTANKLQLTEKERKQLAEYMAKQQENNMRWELAKNKLLIAAMPMVQKIMEWTSKAAVQIANILEKKPTWLNLVRDILLILTTGKVLKTISGLTSVLGGALGGIGKTLGAVGRVTSRKGLGAALGMVGKRLLGGAGGFAFGPVIGAIFTIASTILILKDIYDIVADWFGKKKEEDEETLPTPDDGGTRYQYHNVRSNLTNNFYNNPQPTNTAVQELTRHYNLILAEQYR